MLIKCPECNGTVSDSAKMCPHCGFPVKDWQDEMDSYVDSYLDELREERLSRS